MQQKTKKLIKKIIFAVLNAQCLQQYQYQQYQRYGIMLPSVFKKHKIWSNCVKSFLIVR